MLTLHSPGSRSEDRRSLVALVVFAAILVTGGGVAVAQGGPVVESGTTLNASTSGPTITITEQLTLNDSTIFPDGQTVDLSPNATFSSDSKTNVTVDTIDGEWTNLSTHDVAAGLDADPTDKQAVTITGDDVSSVSFQDVDAGSPSVDVVYTADAEVTLLLTNLPASTQLEAIDTATQATIDTNTTDADGSTAFVLGAATSRTVSIREPPSTGTTSDDTGGGGEPAQTTVETTQTDTGTEATIERVTMDDPTVTVETTETSADGVSVMEASATFEKATNTDNTMTVSAHSAPPPDTPPPPDNDDVVSYVDITIEGSLADSVSEGRFTVDVSDSGVDADQVTAQRYDGSEWEAVETNPIDDTTVEVISPEGYSSFAIGVSETGEATQPTATPTTIETDTATPTPTPVSTAVPTPTPAAASDQTPTSMPGGSSPTAGTADGDDSGPPAVSWTLLGLVLALAVVFLAVLLWNPPVGEEIEPDDHPEDREPESTGEDTEPDSPSGDVESEPGDQSE